MDKLNERLYALLNEGERRYNSTLSRYEKEELKIYRKALDDIRAELFKLPLDMTFTEANKYNRLLNLEGRIQSIINGLNKSAVGIGKNAIKETYTDAFYFTAYSWESTLNSKLGFGLLRTEAVNAAIINEYDKIKWPTRLKAHSEQLVQQIRTEISTGLIKGLPYDKIARNIKARADIGAYNTLRIVRTETHRAQSAGKIVSFDKAAAAAEKLGYKIARKWDATLDQKTRNTHRDLDGKSPDAEGFYITALGSKLIGPGYGPHALPADVINCRCHERQEIEDMPLKTRRDNESGELVKYQTYNEWAETRGIPNKRKN